MKLFFIIIAMAICQPSSAQIFDKIKKTVGKVANTISLDKLSRDPVTTSFNDVNKTKYLEDNFGNDAVYKNIHDQPYTWEEGFFLTPGFYEGNFISFCIKAGTYAPQSGNGRFYADLKGPKADIVSAIIERYQQNPDITQKDVQLLLWAIVAKTDFQKMKGEVKLVALKVLTPDEIARLSKGALEEYASNEIIKIAKKNESLRYIIEAENNLRKKYYQGINEYSEYEAVAMRAGVEPVFKGFNKGRWTKHPNGFFIRYRLQGYRGTLTQIYVPENSIEAYAPIKGKGPYTNDFDAPIVGTHYKSRNSIATPSNPAGQRIIQSDVPPGGGDVWGSGSGGSGGAGGAGGSGGTGGTGGTGGSGGTGGTGGAGGSGGGGTTGSGGSTGGNNGSGGTGGTGGNTTGTTLPPNEYEPNPFDCEEVVNLIADETIKLEMLKQNIPGLLVCVFRGDSIIHMKAYGKMRYDSKLTLETELQWASVSKSVTGVAALQMVENGLLKLSDRPSQLLTYWPNAVNVKDEDGKKVTEEQYSNISLRHLLTNSSGIQHYGSGRDDRNFTTYKGRKIPFKHNNEYTPAINGAWSAKSSVEQFNYSVLDTIPGSNFLYSSYGFNLAGAMIDSKMNYGYDSWVEKNIAKRLGLRSFSMAKGSSNRYGYQFIEDGILTNAPLADHDDVLPAGGWESTICDLATYTRALSQGELLADESALWSDKNMYVFNASSVRGYGLGVYRRGVGDTLRVYHGGTNSGSRAYLHFFPSDHTGVVLLAPFRQASLERVAANLFNDLKLHAELYGTSTKPLDRCHNGMESGKDIFTGIWKKTSNEQILRTGLELVEFRDEMNIMRDYDYHLEDFEVHMTEDKKTIYDGVFKKGKKIQLLITQLDNISMRAEIDRLRAQGLEIIDIEFSATAPGLNKIEEIALNALFEKEAPKSDYATFSSRVNMLNYTRDNQNKFNFIDVESHPTKKSSDEDSSVSMVLYVAGKGNKVAIESPLRFKEKMENGSYASLGSLVDVDMYQNGTSPDLRFVLSIWNPSGIDDIRTSYVPAKQPALSFCSFMDMHETNANDGYELIDFDRIFTIVDK